MERAKDRSTRSVGWQIEGVSLEEALQGFQVLARRVESTRRFAAERIHQRVVLRMRRKREVSYNVTPQPINQLLLDQAGAEDDFGLRWRDKVAFRYRPQRRPLLDSATIDSDGGVLPAANVRRRRIYRAVDYTSVVSTRGREYDMSLSSYGELATEVYDITKPLGHSFGDVEFYLERLKSCTGRVLEPAVGTGRVLIPLMEAGLEIEGADNSPEMLAVCRARCAERGLEPVLHEEDMGSLSSPERYEAIIVPAGSFLLIERREESLGTLQRFRDHLLPGGRLILDLELQTDFRVGTISTGTVETPQGDTITVESKVVEVNFLEQYSISHLRYEKWRDGELVRTEMQRFPLRWYGLEEFELVLKSLGFSEVVVSADYEYGKRPSRAEQTFTFETRRA